MSTNKNVFGDRNLFDVNKCVNWEDIQSKINYKTVFTTRARSNQAYFGARGGSSKYTTISFLRPVLIEKVKLGFYDRDKRKHHYEFDISMDADIYETVHKASVIGFDEFSLTNVVTKFIRIRGWCTGHGIDDSYVHISQFHVYGREADDKEILTSSGGLEEVVMSEMMENAMIFVEELDKENSVVAKKDFVVESSEGDVIASIPFFVFFFPELRKELNDSKLKITVPSSEWKLDGQLLLKTLLNVKPKWELLLDLYHLFHELDMRTRVFLVCREVNTLGISEVIELLRAMVKIEDIETIVEMDVPKFRHPFMYSLMNVLKQRKEELNKKQRIFMSRSMLIEVMTCYKVTPPKNWDYFKNTEFPNSHFDIFRTYLPTRKDYNMKLQCGGKLFDVHLEVLFMRSEFFRRQFSFGQGIEFEMFKKTGILPLTSEYFTEEVTEKYLEYLYNGVFKCEKFPELFNLVNIASMDGDKKLHAICVELVQEITKNKVEKLGESLENSVHILNNESIVKEFFEFWKDFIPEGEGENVEEWIRNSKKDQIIKKLEEKVDKLEKNEKLMKVKINKLEKRWNSVETFLSEKYGYQRT